MTFAADLLEMMNNWDRLVAAARKSFPSATEEEVYQLAKQTMNQKLRLNLPGCQD